MSDEQERLLHKLNNNNNNNFITTEGPHSNISPDILNLHTLNVKILENQ